MIHHVVAISAATTFVGAGRTPPATGPHRPTAATAPGARLDTGPQAATRRSAAGRVPGRVRARHLFAARLDAPATAVADGDHHGNGHHNRNLISVHSPTLNRGYQHTSNGNAGGLNPVQNGLCRHVTVCTIVQKVNVVRPEPPKAPVAAEPEPVAPAEHVAPPAPTPAVEVLPQAGTQSRPAPAPVLVPRARPRGPFLYLGAEGFMMMVPGAGGGFGTSGGGLLPFGLLG
jgi:hypothetical protein